MQMDCSFPPYLALFMDRKEANLAIKSMDFCSDGKNKNCIKLVAHLQGALNAYPSQTVIGIVTQFFVRAMI